MESAHFSEGLHELPQWPKVVGTISIVWASLGLACGSCGMGALFFMPRLMKGAEDKLGPMPPALMPAPAQLGLGAVGLLWAFVLLSAGIVTVSRRPAGRPLHLLHGSVALVLGAAGILLQLKQMGELSAWVAANPGSKWAEQMKNPGSQAGRVIGLVFGAVLSFVWPIFCLAWFAPSKRSAELAMREPPVL
jgi:hypothetical protein